MCAVGNERNDLAFVEHCLEQGVLRDMTTPPIGVVHDDDIARFVDICTKFVDHPFDRELDRPDL